jgi:acetyl-CoA carboxylase biotin carboxyl carrier protein
VDLTNADVADVLALLDSLPYDELDIQTPRFRLSLRRVPGGGWTQSTQVLSPPNVVDVIEHQPETFPDISADDAGGVRGLAEVRAPLPGTFYRAPRPGAAAFVEVGSQVSEDTVVGIVETMKLMNSVHAGIRGRVAEICLANAEFAAHGAALMRVAAEP